VIGFRNDFFLLLESYEESGNGIGNVNVEFGKRLPSKVAFVRKSIPFDFAEDTIMVFTDIDDGFDDFVQ